MISCKRAGSHLPLAISCDAISQRAEAAGSFLRQKIGASGPVHQHANLSGMSVGSRAASSRDYIWRATTSEAHGSSPGSIRPITSWSSSPTGIGAVPDAGLPCSIRARTRS